MQVVNEMNAGQHNFAAPETEMGAEQGPRSRRGLGHSLWQSVSATVGSEGTRAGDAGMGVGVGEGEEVPWGGAVRKRPPRGLQMCPQHPHTDASVACCFMMVIGVRDVGFGEFFGIHWHRLMPSLALQ